VQGSDGDFYGTTNGGGATGGGTVFKITSGGSLTTLYSFRVGGHSNPTSELVQGRDGDFYGTTNDAGSDWPYVGMVFKITSGGSLTTLYSFCCGDGFYPYAGLVQGRDGDFYGTTINGGASFLGISAGTVFKITSGGSLTTLYSFSGIDGAYPLGGLVQGSGGDFYGTTYGGGSSGAGTVFKITAIVAPTNADQCKNDRWAIFTSPRTFQNQGDCIQFVNTGK
jgi:uncharacterized repeat protein (TIGR03803 family)